MGQNCLFIWLLLPILIKKSTSGDFGMRRYAKLVKEGNKEDKNAFTAKVNRDGPMVL